MSKILRLRAEKEIDPEVRHRENGAMIATLILNGPGTRFVGTAARAHHHHGHHWWMHASAAAHWHAW